MSCCGLVDPRIIASDKDLPVSLVIRSGKGILTGSRVPPLLPFSFRIRTGPLILSGPGRPRGWGWVLMGVPLKNSAGRVGASIS